MVLPTSVTVIVDILTFALGTYGAIILVGEFVELDRFPSPGKVWQILRDHWKAVLAFLIANLLFFLRVYSGLTH